MVKFSSWLGRNYRKVMRPAWAPGSERRRWGGAIVTVCTDDGIVGLDAPGYDYFATHRIVDQAAELIGIRRLKRHKVRQSLGGRERISGIAV